MKMYRIDREDPPPETEGADAQEQEEDEGDFSWRVGASINRLMDCLIDGWVRLGRVESRVDFDFEAGRLSVIQPKHTLPYDINQHRPPWSCPSSASRTRRRWWWCAGRFTTGSGSGISNTISCPGTRPRSSSPPTLPCTPASSRSFIRCVASPMILLFIYLVIYI